jgi:hypothetical protein
MPSPETVEKAVNALKRAADVEYFFSKLSSPGWIEPLQEKGFFSNPPEPEREGEYVRFPFWPESQYLARMAPKKPKLVLSVLQRLTRTENPRIHEDIIEAAVAMPAGLAARLVPAALRWLDSAYLLLLPQKLERLVLHLAQGGQLDPALDLAEALLTPASIEPPTGEKLAQLFTRELRPRYDRWQYEQVAHGVVPALAAVDVAGTIGMLCDLIQRSVESLAPGATPPHDRSTWWRSAIEPSSQNHHVSQLLDVLVDVLRDTVVELVASDPSTLEDVVRLLEGRPWRIFHRIALHLLSSEMDTGWELVQQRVLDGSLGDDTNLHHEYWLLVRAAFPRLGHADQQRIIDAIQAGPAHVPEENAEQYAKSWRWRRLGILKDVLGEQWRDRYDSLVTEIGLEPDHPEFLHYSSTMWTGPTSPQTAGELLAMSDDDLVDLLRNWESTEQFMSPSYEGLSRALSQAVAQQPERLLPVLLAQAEALAMPYLHGVLEGLHEALRSSVPFDWRTALAFSARAVERHLQVQVGQSSTRDEAERLISLGVAQLLSAGFAHSEIGIPSVLRDQAWALLERLTADPDPTPEREAALGGTSMDPPTLAINTARGEAMHAVVRYVGWLYRSVSTEDGGASTARPGLPSEVRAVLDEHLDSTIEPSAAVRSMYGQWLPHLTFLDASWVQQRLRDIFPTDPEEAYLRDAAWDTYIIFCQPDDVVFGLLRDEYRAAVNRLDTTAPPPDGLHGSVHARLGQHLVLLVLRGTLDVEDELVRTYFDRASPADRHAALTYVGRLLVGAEDITPDVIARAQQLWEVRRAATTANRNAGELIAFGWWFSSAKLPDAWSLAQLVAALRLTNGNLDVSRMAFERLAELAAAFPTEAVEAVRLLAEGDREGWMLTGTMDQLRTVLSTALSSEQLEAREVATNLLHRLGARGFYELRYLLETPWGEGS